MIDPERVFNEIFNDKNIVEKLAITAVMSFLVIIPLFGLVALAALLGYQIEMIRSVRDGMAYPVPRWAQIGEKINLGVGIMIAFAIYNLPNIFAICIVSAITSVGADGGVFVIAVLCCCVTPVLLLINLITIPLQAVGTVRFADTGRVESFFNFADLFDTVRNNTTLLFQWWIWSLLANLLIGGLGSVIPCIGWLAMAALLIPVQGHLMGQLALQLAQGKQKNQWA
jgi:Protein of unknown function (DUF4013)